MKITEDDLKKIFKDDDGPKFEPNLKVKKIRPHQDELMLKKVKKEISKTAPTKKNKEKKNKKGPGSLDRLLMFSAVVGIVAFSFYVAMNYTAFKKQFYWLYYSEYLNQKAPEGKISTNSPTRTSTPTATSTPDSLGLPESIPSFNEDPTKQDRLIIGKISVDVPISWNVPENEILSKLTSGVVHYENTSLPGNGGNIFIVGHSSNYSWIHSDYNSVFALLDKLIRGDQVEIYANGRRYVYSVSDKRVIEAKNVEVLDETKLETLTLMTCWPVGTSLNRLIIQANLVRVDI